MSNWGWIFALIGGIGAITTAIEKFLFHKMDIDAKFGRWVDTIADLLENWFDNINVIIGDAATAFGHWLTNWFQSKGDFINVPYQVIIEPILIFLSNGFGRIIGVIMLGFQKWLITAITKWTSALRIDNK